MRLSEVFRITESDERLIKLEIPLYMATNITSQLYMFDPKVHQDPWEGPHDKINMNRLRSELWDGGHVELTVPEARVVANIIEHKLDGLKASLDEFPPDPHEKEVHETVLRELKSVLDALIKQGIRPNGWKPFHSDFGELADQ